MHTQCKKQWRESTEAIEGVEYKGEDKPLKGGEESQPMHCVPSNPPPNENPEGIKGGYKSTLYKVDSVFYTQLTMSKLYDLS